MFYWVNLGASYKEVAEYKFLWAPSYTLNATGTKIVNRGWQHVQDVRKDDVIFCHENGRILYVAVAKKDAYPSPRPPNRAFDQWKNEGFKIDVELEVLEYPVHTNEFKETFFQLFNDRCSPKLFTIKKQAAQYYMISLPDGAGALLLDAIGEISLRIQDMSTGMPGVVKETERQAIVKSRIGQGKFRDEVLALWGGTCPITYVDYPEFLIASHIVPWQLSTNYERLDKYNGLPLSPSVDKLFDGGYISFSDKGALIINPKLPESVVEKLGVTPGAVIRGLHPDNIKYLSRHREIFGFKSKE